MKKYARWQPTSPPASPWSSCPPTFHATSVPTRRSCYFFPVFLLEFNLPSFPFWCHSALTLHFWITAMAVMFWESQGSYIPLLISFYTPYPYLPFMLVASSQEEMILWLRSEKALGLQETQGSNQQIHDDVGAQSSLCPGESLQDSGERQSWKESQRKAGDWERHSPLFPSRLDPGGVGEHNKNSIRLRDSEQR